MPRRKGGATSANLNLMEQEQGDSGAVKQEMKEPGVSLAMLLPAMLTATKSFVEGGVPRAPAVRNYFKQMLDIYESASPEARAMLDKVGGATLEGFNAWASNGMVQRGKKAVEWAGMVRGLPLLQGGRRELDLPEIAQAKSAVNERETRATAERAGVDYEDWKAMDPMERRRVAMDKGREEGLKKFGIPQFADFLFDTVSYIPGMAVPAKVARRFAGIPGMKGYKSRQSFGDKLKDFAKEDLPGIAFDVAKSYMPGGRNVPNPLGRGRKQRGRGMAVAKPEKQWQNMSVEERLAVPFQKVAKQQSEALSKRESEFRAENERFKNMTKPGGVVWDTIQGMPVSDYSIANPKDNKDMETDIDKLAGLQNWQYEQMMDKYESSQRGAQQRERPDLKLGSREQKQDLEMRQRKAEGDKKLEGMKKERQKTLSDAMAREQAFAKQRNATKGKGGCDACGSAAPSAGFLRKVLGKYGKTGKMRGGMEPTQLAPFVPPRQRVEGLPAPLNTPAEMEAYGKKMAENRLSRPGVPAPLTGSDEMEVYGALMAHSKGVDPTMVLDYRAKVAGNRRRLLEEAKAQAVAEEDDKTLREVNYALMEETGFWVRRDGTRTSPAYWQNTVTQRRVYSGSQEALEMGLEQDQPAGFYRPHEEKSNEKYGYKR